MTTKRLAEIEADYKCPPDDVVELIAEVRRLRTVLADISHITEAQVESALR